MAGAGAGLEGVVATSSKICFIDGSQGILSYFGYNIHTLADNATFEEVIYLLWNGKLPNKQELAGLKSALVAERELPNEVIAFSVPAMDWNIKCRCAPASSAFICVVTCARQQFCAGMRHSRMS